MNVTGRADDANGFDPDFAGPQQWAEMYRRHGFQVVPAWSPAEHKQWKRPKLKGWRDLQNQKMTQAYFDQVWAENATRRNMGLITGPCSDNQFIVDLDTQKTPAAADWWNGLLAVHNNNMPLETCEQRTGGGGRQLLFRAPPGYVVPTCKTARGVDIRGWGGFAMLPPSMHESGHAYEWLPGQAPGEIDVYPAPLWLLEAIAALVKEHGGPIGARPQHDVTGDNNGQKFASSDPSISVDGFGNVVDGREQLMRDVVWHAVLELYRENPIPPPERDWPALAEGAYEEYERKVDTRIPGLSKREGLAQEYRGQNAFLGKWLAAMRRWGDEGFTRDANEPRPEPKPEIVQIEEKKDLQLYDRLNVKQIKALPDPKWLVDKLIVENALGFVFGAPSSVKTFFALDLSLSLATGQTEWWGRGIGRSGAVVYISSEGMSDLKFRIMAWEQHRGVDADDAPFWLVHESINFTKQDDIRKLLATVQAIADEAGPIAAVFVDTVSRVLPGVDENLQKDMTTFVTGCDAVRKAFGATVIGLHHVSRAGNMRGSTVIPAAGDFVIEMKREVGEEEGSFYVSKLKAGEDGWTQHFKVTKLEIGAFGTQTSLVLDPIDAPEAASKWPDQNMRDRILYAVTEGWTMGKPWSSSPQSGERYAPRIMEVKFKIPIRTGKDWMEKALIDGVLSNEIYDEHSKMRGLKVVPVVAPQ
jgi:hypothetical protein